MLSVAASLLVLQSVGTPVCGTDLPANIRPGIFRQEMIRLLDLSQTFREQCDRLAAAPHVRVVVAIDRNVPAGSRAQTVIERYEAGAVIAWVSLKFGEDYVELIPHELEHVIEQIDGVRLTEELGARRAWLAASGGYETKRATAAGVRVRQELEASAVEAAQYQGLKAPALRHPFN